MNKHLLHTTLRRFRGSFLAHFQRITEQDLRLILTGPSEMLLTVVQMRYGYSRAQAKVVWNDFVLRSVDGHPLDPTSMWASPHCEDSAPLRGQHDRRQMDFGRRLWASQASTPRVH